MQTDPLEKVEKNMEEEEEIEDGHDQLFVVVDWYFI